MASVFDCNGGGGFLNPSCWFSTPPGPAGPAAPAAPSTPPGISAELNADLWRASAGNATLYAAAVAQAQREQADLATQQENDPLPDPFGINNFINDIAGATKTAAVTVGLVQVAFVGIAAFALYKILSSDTARQNIVELVKAK